MRRHRAHDTTNENQTMMPAANATIQRKMTVGSTNDPLEHQTDAMADKVMQTVQRKMTVGATNDPMEYEADAMADKVMRMPDTPFVQRKCASYGQDDERVHLKPLASFIQAKGEGGAISNSVDGKIQSTRGGGNPIAGQTKIFMESRFGQDFSGVRVHTGDYAVQMSNDLNAQAFTTGSNVYFNSGKYAPETSDGQRLLAHELTHVVQQAKASRIQRSSNKVQRQYSTQSSPVSNPNSLIPITDFISYVEVIESIFASDTPMQIVTRIRQEYYKGLAFELLIPDAHYQTANPYSQPPAGGGVPFYHTNDLSDMRWGNKTTQPAYDHLTAHADENGIGDNPSPYIVMPDGSRIDVGHLLLGLDSLLNPRVDKPYTSYGITGIDPAGFAADLALASYWTTYHEKNGTSASDAAVHPASANFDTYYKASAPNEDLLGDSDAFGAYKIWASTPGQKLSQVLRTYYLGVSGNAPGVNYRWRTFCSANGLGYTVKNGLVTWASNIESKWGPRINTLCELFNAGFFSHVGSAVIGTSADPGSWPYSLPALRRFLDWLKTRLETEISTYP